MEVSGSMVSGHALGSHSMPFQQFFGNNVMSEMFGCNRYFLLVSTEENVDSNNCGYVVELVGHQPCNLHIECHCRRMSVPRVCHGCPFSDTCKVD